MVWNGNRVDNKLCISTIQKVVLRATVLLKYLLGNKKNFHICKYSYTYQRTCVICYINIFDHPQTVNSSRRLFLILDDFTGHPYSHKVFHVRLSCLLYNEYITQLLKSSTGRKKFEFPQSISYVKRWITSLECRSQPVHSVWNYLALFGNISYSRGSHSSIFNVKSGKVLRNRIYHQQCITYLYICLPHWNMNKARAAGMRYVLHPYFAHAAVSFAIAQIPTL